MRLFKIFILAFLFLGGSPGFGLCQVIDETGSGQVIANEDIPDRPMRDDPNLKAIQTAFDTSDPRANIKRFPYDPDVTYKIRLREFMGCTIVLPEGERIAGYTLFDQHNFTFTPLSDKNPVLTNIFDVYAKYHGADTNLVVHGSSGNIYSFYMRVDSVDSRFMPSLVTYIQDPATTRAIEREAAQAAVERMAAEKAKEKEAAEKARGQEIDDSDYLASLPTKIAPEDLNFAYEFKGGDKDLQPIRVFDDGHFTFFQYGTDNLDKVKKLPAIYRVVDGFDTPVNTRISGGCIVAETTNDKWTLRSGGTHFCIWKDK